MGQSAEILRWLFCEPARPVARSAFAFVENATSAQQIDVTQNQDVSMGVAAARTSAAFHLHARCRGAAPVARGLNSASSNPCAATLCRPLSISEHSTNEGEGAAPWISTEVIMSSAEGGV
jgi:hypothetical protein